MTLRSLLGWAMILHTVVSSPSQLERFVPQSYDCSVYESCHVCVQDINCGWCAGERTCVSGSAHQPLAIDEHGKKCTAFDFFSCPGFRCGAYHSCEGCSRDQFCGWCSQTWNCVSRFGMKPLSQNCGVGFVSDPLRCGGAGSAFQGAGTRVVTFPLLDVLPTAPSPAASQNS
eukprot:c4242_g1_i1.p2 GENE.c4242_g1_i1~~c4242_g1_i1.p2  ORF type:complete len:172 (+),score=23.62 c4242_g1_i1:156-671(+)